MEKLTNTFGLGRADERLRIMRMLMTTKATLMRGQGKIMSMTAKATSMQGRVFSSSNNKSRLGVLECSWWYEGVGGGDGGGSGGEWHWWMVVVDDGGGEGGGW
ncbi:hypothetical protein Tco_0833047 [Tanacetum coccineum]